ncbi:hypothetical protein JCM24511_04170 [Saitozyma sp. JCM 24511]|nr:hypothetical protein JCM24511_04170 [Saitozyma sp. JCM 24511]
MSVCLESKNVVLVKSRSTTDEGTSARTSGTSDAPLTSMRLCLDAKRSSGVIAQLPKDILSLGAPPPHQ